MATYKIDSVVVDTDKALDSWTEKTFWDGRNRISVPTGSQWDHEELYKSRKGRYYIVSWSQWQGSVASARFVEPLEAAQWLMLNGKELPEDLADYEEEACQ